MKLLKCSVIAAAVLVMWTATSCNKANGGNDSDSIKKQIAMAENQALDISDIKNATFSDSVSYYMGLTSATDFWAIAEQDTTLAGAENAKQYQEGFKAGMKQMQQNRAYALGYMQAMQVANNIKEAGDQLNLKLDPVRAYQGFNYGMKGKDAVDPAKYQASMMQVQTHMQTLINEKMGQDPTAQMQPQQGQQMQSLAQPAADKAGANLKTRSGIRYKVVKGGQGSSPALGDIVTVAMAFKDANGNIINTTKNGDSEYMSFPLTTKDVPEPILIEAIQTMKPGGHSMFFVPTPTGDGKYTEVILDIKLSNVTKQ